jgi:proline racemase
MSGYPHLAMPGVIAAARAASEHGLVSARATDDHVERRLVFDTPAGTISARTRRDDVAPRDVVVGGVRAFVQAHGVSVPLPGRAVPVDVAFSGEFYALVDGEAAGVVLDSGHVADLRRLGRALCTALNRTTALVHPQDSAATGVAGVVFTGPARDEHAHLRTVLVSIDGAVDWSAGGSAAPAVMAVLDAMGLIGDGAPGFVHEGLSDTFGEGRVTARTTTDEREELVVEVRHELWATGEQIWLLDHDDPFVQGLPMPAREAVR